MRGWRKPKSERMHDVDVCGATADSSLTTPKLNTTLGPRALRMTPIILDWRWERKAEADSSLVTPELRPQKHRPLFREPLTDALLGPRSLRMTPSDRVALLRCGARLLCLAGAEEEDATAAYGIATGSREV